MTVKVGFFFLIIIPVIPSLTIPTCFHEREGVRVTETNLFDCQLLFAAGLKFCKFEGFLSNGKNPLLCGDDATLGLPFKENLILYAAITPCCISTSD